MRSRDKIYMHAQMQVCVMSKQGIFVHMQSAQYEWNPPRQGSPAVLRRGKICYNHSIYICRYAAKGPSVSVAFYVTFKLFASVLGCGAFLHPAIAKSFRSWLLNCSYIDGTTMMKPVLILGLHAVAQSSRAWWNQGDATLAKVFRLGTLLVWFCLFFPCMPSPTSFWTRFGHVQPI